MICMWIYTENLERHYCFVNVTLLLDDVMLISVEMTAAKVLLSVLTAYVCLLTFRLGWKINADSSQKHASFLPLVDYRSVGIPWRHSCFVKTATRLFLFYTVRLLPPVKGCQYVYSEQMSYFLRTAHWLSKVFSSDCREHGKLGTKAARRLERPPTVRYVLPLSGPLNVLSCLEPDVLWFTVPLNNTLWKQQYK